MSSFQQVLDSTPGGVHIRGLTWGHVHVTYHVTFMWHRLWWYYSCDKCDKCDIVWLLGGYVRSIKNRTMDPTKEIKGYINGRMVPTNASRLHNLSGNISKLFGFISKLFGFITWLLFNILVSCSSTKRFFTPPKKMMAHQWPIKRLFWPSKGCSGPSIAHQRLFPAQNKMMAHRKALPGTKIKWWTIKRLFPALMAVRLPSKRADLPSNWPPTVILVFYFRFFGYVFCSFMFGFFTVLFSLFWIVFLVCFLLLYVCFF